MWRKQAVDQDKMVRQHHRVAHLRSSTLVLVLDELGVIAKLSFPGRRDSNFFLQPAAGAYPTRTSNKLQQ